MLYSLVTAAAISGTVSATPNITVSSTHCSLLASIYYILAIALHTNAGTWASITVLICNNYPALAQG